MTRGSTRSVGRSTYFFGALGGLLFGYDVGIVAGALLFISPEFGLTPLEKGVVTSSLLVGAMVGALYSGRVSDRVGRRPVVLAAAALFIIGALLAAFAPGVTMIAVGRLVMGLAVGCTSVTVPVFLSEIAPARHRGALSGLNQLMISSGFLLAYLASLALTPTENWRLMFGLAAVPAALLFVGALYQPESPRWLVGKGREDEARRVLTASRTAEELETELREIRNAGTSSAERTSLRELLRSARLRPVLVLGIGLAVLQQVVGINTVIYYAPTVLVGIGFGTTAAIVANAGLGLLTVVVTVIMIALVDRIGRRRPLIYGSLGMAASMALLGVLFSVGSGPDGGAAGWLAIAGLAAFKISFSLSWGGLMWILLGEIFPLRVRGTAMGAATFMNWLANFAVGLLFPVVLSLGNGIAFFIFVGFSLTAFVFAVTKVPETKGRSLEQIESMLVRTTTTEPAADPRP